MTVHALAHDGFAILCDQARLVVLGDKIVQVVIGLQNDAAAASAVAAAGAALGDVSFAMKCDAALAAVPGARVNLDFVNEHGSMRSFVSFLLEPRYLGGYKQ